MILVGFVKGYKNPLSKFSLGSREQPFTLQAEQGLLIAILLSLVRSSGKAKESRGGVILNGAINKPRDHVAVLNGFV